MDRMALNNFVDFGGCFWLDGRSVMGSSGLRLGVEVGLPEVSDMLWPYLGGLGEG